MSDLAKRLRDIAEMMADEGIGRGDWCDAPTLREAADRIEAMDGKKKLVGSMITGLTKLGSLVFPILLAMEMGLISESKVGELLGKDIVSVREIKHETANAVMAMVESLPSPLILLLDGMKEKQGSSTKSG